MNKFIHISEKFRRDSIFKHGLLPSTIQLSNHLDTFKHNGHLSDVERKMLYTWLSSEKDNKFIKDMIYCKMWIEPRNNFGMNYIEDANMSLLPHNILYWTPYTNMIFDVYEISNFSAVTTPDFYIHCQEPNDCKYNTLKYMDERYAHDDKLLGLSKSVERDFKIIKQAFVDVNKKGKLQIKIKDI